MSALTYLRTGPKRQIYVAGPMSGIPEFNFPRFNAVTAYLRYLGHEVFNPAEADEDRHGEDISQGNTTGSTAEAKEKHGFSIRHALGEDLSYICQRANVIVMLPSWERSNGAQAEHRTAVAIGSHAGEEMEILYLTDEDCQLATSFQGISNARR